MIDLKGFLVGIFSSFFSLVIVCAIVGLILLLYLDLNFGLYQTGTFENGHVVLLGTFLFIIGLSLSSFLNGWLTAKFSKNNKYFTSIFVGFVIACLSLIPIQGKSLQFTLIIALIPMPLSYFGVMYFEKRVSKFKNSRTLCVFGRAENARSFVCR